MQENEKTYERDIYMEERNEELEMSADTELKKETEIQTSENSEKASADSEPEKKERPGFLPEYTFSIQVISSAQTC